ncbi:unnamed protein product [Heligmosomoides polygyrus]|uniref:Uncharacterized protein n=1 Tax=Heligmosomoides polygyrus TaxID=6339 RepID=A0A183F3Z3_HELPZ|nr:unnamed protein product [Heligmosomoides polygyrus]
MKAKGTEYIGGEEAIASRQAHHVLRTVHEQRVKGDWAYQFPVWQCDPIDEDQNTTTRDGGGRNGKRKGATTERIDGTSRQVGGCGCGQRIFSCNWHALLPNLFR